MRVKRVGLKDHRNVAVLRSNIVYQSVTNEDSALANLFKTRDHSKGGGLSAPGWSYQHKELLVLHFDIDVAHCGYFTEALRHMFQGYACHSTKLLTPIDPAPDGSRLDRPILGTPHGTRTRADTTTLSRPAETELSDHRPHSASVVNRRSTKAATPTVFTSPTRSSKAMSVGGASVASTKTGA